MPGPVRQSVDKPVASLDLLLRGAIAVTGDPARPIVHDACIGVRGDRIAVIESGPGPSVPVGVARTMDCHGRVVIPGLVNIHTHAALTYVRGVAEDLGFAPAYTPGIPTASDLQPEDTRALARLGALEAMLFGSTLINDSYVHSGVTIEAMAELGLRIHASERIHDVDFDEVRSGSWRHSREIGERTLNAAVALAERWHGRENGRIGVQLTAHAPDTCSDSLLHEIRAARDRYGLIVNTHLAQSQVELARVRTRSGMSSAELLDEVGLLDGRLVAAHCLFLESADITRVGRAGVTVAHIPKGNATGGAIAPTARLRDAGARLALGTDNMHADMIEVMRWALAVGRIQTGGVSSDWQPHHVLDMATMEGARALGLAGEIGSLEVGKKADLAVLDFRRPHLTPCVNPLGNVIHTAQGRDVETVIVDGQIVVEHGRPTRVSEQDIRKDATRAVQRIWSRV